MKSTVVRVDPSPATVTRVRAQIRSDLSDLPRAVVDDVALALSELLNNAVCHGSALPDGSIHAAWNLTSDGVEVCVTDGGGLTDPAVHVAGPRDIDGRGLSIVGTLADAWGTRHIGGGTTVWALFVFRQLADHRAADGAS